MIETLVVIAMIALLIGIQRGSLGAARAPGRTVVCRSNLRQVVTAALMDTQDNWETVWHANLWIYKAWKAS